MAKRLKPDAVSDVVPTVFARSINYLEPTSTSLRNDNKISKLAISTIAMFQRYVRIPGSVVVYSCHALVNTILLKQAFVL